MSDEATMEKIVQVAVVHPGDVLVVALPRDLSMLEFHRYNEMLRVRLPETVRSLVVGGAIHLSIMRAEEAE